MSSGAGDEAFTLVLNDSFINETMDFWSFSSLRRQSTCRFYLRPSPQHFCPRAVTMRLLSPQRHSELCLCMCKCKWRNWDTVLGSCVVIVAVPPPPFTAFASTIIIFLQFTGLWMTAALTFRCRLCFSVEAANVILWNILSANQHTSK